MDFLQSDINEVLNQERKKLEDKILFLEDRLREEQNNNMKMRLTNSKIIGQNLENEMRANLVELYPWDTISTIDKAGKKQIYCK
ncbi:hypothetical protein [Spiroplasma chrysopicola]|uniref:Uncharacterized protein n=1 Tax=Spiroplasma chrysopicola DF-1 TaxID=1276227 RepID=R4U0W4_9MOLU|nr:hypothetical protein [Spiroplasma chrysopicola]AGM24937.1 hypothetical protein SCHRY_v1c03540 [Spiroplasma chrysopicola DF-1]